MTAPLCPMHDIDLKEARFTYIRPLSIGVLLIVGDIFLVVVATEPPNISYCDLILALFDMSVFTAHESIAI